MLTPQNAVETQRFLGMVNCVNKFLPRLSDLAEPLRKTLLKDVTWTWTSEQQRAYDVIKRAVT